MEQCLPYDILVNGKDQLQCNICYQLMIKPVKLKCKQPSNHIFGLQCLTKWWSKTGLFNCPYCRQQNVTFEYYPNYQQIINEIEFKCQYCYKIDRIINYQQHQLTCEKYMSKINQQLTSQVNREKQILEKQINPHLRVQHNQIYQNYVQDWKWLSQDTRDWKWWWWANLPWWKQPCSKCNELWHKYEIQIDLIEQKRVRFIKQIKKISSNS